MKGIIFKGERNVCSAYLTHTAAGATLTAVETAKKEKRKSRTNLESTDTKH
jgi:hypothetical protein